MKTHLVRQILDKIYAENGWLVVIDGDQAFWGDRGASRRYRLLTMEEAFPHEGDDDDDSADD